MPDPAIEHPWDEFHRKALAAGMKPATAAAGRALMRECHQHQWEHYLGSEIRKLCGYEDAGANMISFGLAHAEIAADLWEHLTIDDAGNNPRSRTPKKLQPLVMESFQANAFPLELKSLPSPSGSKRKGTGRDGISL